MGESLPLHIIQTNPCYFEVNLTSTRQKTECKNLIENDVFSWQSLINTMRKFAIIYEIFAIRHAREAYSVVVKLVVNNKWINECMLVRRRQWSFVYSIQAPLFPPLSIFPLPYPPYLQTDVPSPRTLGRGPKMGGLREMNLGDWDHEEDNYATLDLLIYFTV